MGDNKRYYWLKLKDDFFDSRKMKKLRKVAGGDTYTIIYLKLQLLSINNEGVIEFEGTDEDIYHQLALDIDEEIDDIKMTLAFCNANDLIEYVDDDVFLSEVPALIGSETASTRRSRKHRRKQKALQSNGQALQCNTNATKCNTEQEQDIEQEQERREKSKSSREEELTYRCYCQFIKNNSNIDDRDLFDKAIEQYGWRNVLYTLVVIRDERKVKVSSFKYVLEMLRDVEKYDDFTVSYVANREINEMEKKDED
ncbi:phage replisome organizer N-terminal domain-containing protein [Anaerococcus murdochii]|uniref:Phage replisome organizer N-terminal domain-containing protein n=1 Tax=Anaerococcus murdochii TaxID=411577 RepID=A0ABS7SW63_9FIRM|nr:phage replisome organizer N-terminal domain-containing protein [Anaerococcus murdochii]MBZ2385784.1 phage replisome organizer N-terminal domain-containing protein [Anaerococcus murdochii]MBZ2387812.1 phage replisome organizer N-terminal domain-containing protein [Anaerococcus murdochii]